MYKATGILRIRLDFVPKNRTGYYFDKNEQSVAVIGMAG